MLYSFFFEVICNTPSEAFNPFSEGEPINILKQYESKKCFFYVDQKVIKHANLNRFLISQKNFFQKRLSRASYFVVCMDKILVWRHAVMS